MSIEIEIDQYIDVSNSEPIVVDVLSDAYKVNADPLPDSVLLNYKYEIKPLIEGVLTDFKVPATLEEALYVTIPGLRQTLLDELSGQTLALIDEVKYDMNANTADGTINQRLTKLQADYLAAAQSLKNYTLTDELSTAHIAQQYLIDRFTGHYIQEREGWIDSNGDNWDHNESVMNGRMAAQAEFDGNGALVTSAKDVADRDYPLSSLVGKLAWSKDGSYNGTITYSDLTLNGLFPVWKIYTAITSQDIYDKSVRVENQQASYSEDVRAFADNQKAYASKTTELEATSGENTAKISTVAGVMVGDIEYYLIDYTTKASDGSQDPNVGDIAVFTSIDGSFDGSVVTDINNIKDKQDRLEYTATIANSPKNNWTGWEKTLKSEVSGAFDVTAVKINALQAQVDQQIDSWFQYNEPMYLETDVDNNHKSSNTTAIDLVTNDLVWDVNTPAMFKFIAANETSVDLSKETYPTDNRWILAYREPEADWRATDISNSNTDFNSTTSEVYKHKSDLFYDNISGAAYRYTKDDQAQEYRWVQITDTALTKAMADAAKAQSAADGSMKFYTGSTAPDRTYGTNEQMMGDIWVPSSDVTVTDANSNDYVVSNGVEYVWQDDSGVWRWIVSSTANKLNDLLTGSVDGSSIKVSGKTITSYVSDEVNTVTDHMLNVYSGSPWDTKWIDVMETSSNDDRGDLFVWTDSAGTVTTYSFLYGDKRNAIPSDNSDVIALTTNKIIVLDDSTLYMYIAANEDGKKISDEDLTDTTRWVVIRGQWKEVEGASNVKKLADLSDGKRTIYTTAGDPSTDTSIPGSIQSGDIWIPSTDVTIDGVSYVTGYMYYYIDDVWSEPTVLTSIQDSLTQQQDKAFNIFHQTANNLKPAHSDMTDPAIYQLLHGSDEQSDGVKFTNEQLDSMQVLIGDLWECSYKKIDKTIADGDIVAKPQFDNGTTYIFKAIKDSFTYIDVNGDTQNNEYYGWVVANDGMTKLADYSQKNSTIHGGHIEPTLVDKTDELRLNDTNPTAHVGDMWIPDKCIIKLDDGSLVTFTLNKSDIDSWKMENIEPTDSISDDNQAVICDKMKTDIVGEVDVTGIGTVLFIEGRSYTLDTTGTWSENMKYTNDDYTNKVVNGEVALSSNAKVTVNGSEQTILGYVHDTAYNTMNLYNGTDMPGRYDSKTKDGKLRFEGVANGDIYAWHTSDTLDTGSSSIAIEVGYEYIVGSMDLNASLPSPNNNKKYKDVTYDTYSSVIDKSQLLMKTYFIAKRANNQTDGKIEAYWVRTDADKGIVSATIKDFADTTFGRLEDLKDGKRTILIARYINENGVAYSLDKNGVDQVLDTSKLMINDMLILKLDGDNPGGSVSTWITNNYYYIKSETGKYVQRYRPIGHAKSTPLNSDRYNISGSSSFKMNQADNGEYYLVDGEYDSFDFIIRNSGGNRMFGSVKITTINDNEQKYEFYEDGEIFYWSGSLSKWISTAIAARKQIPHWAAGTSNFTTNPETGAITGWSYADGSGIDSEFVIKADNFHIEGSGAEKAQWSESFSIVGAHTSNNSSNYNKIKFNGIVEFNNLSGKPTHQRGTNIKTGTAAGFTEGSTYFNTNSSDTYTVIDGEWVITSSKQDLSSYVTSESLITKLSTYTSNSELSSALSAYAKSSDLTQYQTDKQVANMIANDTTSINGSRITTGTIDAGRISTTGLVVQEVKPKYGSGFEINADGNAGPNNDCNIYGAKIYGANINGGTITGATIDSTSTINTPKIFADEFYIRSSTNPNNYNRLYSKVGIDTVSYQSLHAHHTLYSNGITLVGSNYGTGFDKRRLCNPRSFIQCTVKVSTKTQGNDDPYLGRLSSVELIYEGNVVYSLGVKAEEEKTFTYLIDGNESSLTSKVMLKIVNNINLVVRLSASLSVQILN